MNYINLSTRLYLNEPGKIEINNIFVSEITSSSHECVLLVESTELVVLLKKSFIQKCKSLANNHCGAVSVHNAKEALFVYNCFAHNYCASTPDIILWGSEGVKDIAYADVNYTSFYGSSTSNDPGISCSNWFRAKLLTLNSLNTTSMEAKCRASGISFGAASNNIPVSKFILIDNCTTANYIIEVYSAYELLQELNHFVITSCSALDAVISCVDSKYSLNFHNSVFTKIKANKWKDTNNLVISFDSCSFVSCPPSTGYSSNGGASEWDYAWPNLLKCNELSETICCLHNASKSQFLLLSLVHIMSVN